MEKFNSVEEILELAINSEQQAVDFYKNLAENSTTSDMKKTFTTFMHEEMGHKSRLLEIKQKGNVRVENEEVLDLKISDYIIEVEFEPDMTYQNALIIAMKREKAAYKLYNKLSQMVIEPEMKKTFQMLAQDEAKHKLRFEIEYDEVVLKEN